MTLGVSTSGGESEVFLKAIGLGEEGVMNLGLKRVDLRSPTAVREVPLVGIYSSTSAQA